MIRYLIFFWLLPMTIVGQSSVTLTGAAQCDDAHIKNIGGGDYRDATRNFGAATSMLVHHQVSGSQTTDYRVLIKFPTLASSIGAGARILAETLFVKSIGELDHAGDVHLTYVKKNWTEGTMLGNEAHSYRAGGVSWQYAIQPDYPDTIVSGSLPSAFTWEDSSAVSSAKDQNPQGTCYLFGSTSVFESSHKIQQLLHAGVDINDNGGDGIHVDRTASVLGDTTIGFDTITVTQTGWHWFTLAPKWLAQGWWNGTMSENGVFIRRVGNAHPVNKFKSIEAAGTEKPIIWITYKRKSGGFFEERTARVTAASDILDSYIGSAGATSNHGSDTALIVSDTTVVWIRINDIFHLVDDYGSGEDSTYGIISVKCSLYCFENTTDGKMGSYRAYKQPIESEITWNQWKSGFEWGGAGASKLDEFDVSEEQGLSCANGQGTSGGQIDSSLIFWQAQDSAYVEEDLPYAGTTGDCPAEGSYPYYTSIGWHWSVPVNSATKLKQAILVAPVTITVNDYTSTAPIFPSYAGGCYNHDNSGTYLSHAVALVGWDDNYCSGNGAWRIKNSWSMLWGDRGMAWIQYGCCALLPTVEGQCYLVSTIAAPTAWAEAGVGHVVDRSPVLTTKFVSLTGEEWIGIPVPVGTAQSMYDGTIPNYGFILLGADTTRVSFYSTEWAGSLNDPYLKVWYTFPETKVGDKVTFGDKVKIQ